MLRSIVYLSPAIGQAFEELLHQHAVFLRGAALGRLNQGFALAVGQVDELAGTFFGAIQMTTSTGTIPIADPTITFLAGLTLAGGLTLALTLTFSEGF